MEPRSFLDDVSVLFRLPLARRLSPTTWAQSRELPREWNDVPDAPGVRVAWDGEFAQITMSLPRRRGRRVNFPGLACAADDLRHVAPAVSRFIGATVPDVVTLPLTRVAPTVDIEVEDVPAILRGAEHLHRKHDRRGAMAWSDPVATPVVKRSGVVWPAPYVRDGSRRRTKRGAELELYDKELELRTCHGKAGIVAAPGARGILRITATLFGLDAIRNAVDGCAPTEALTLATFLREPVRDHVIGRQLARLRVDEALDDVDVSDDDVVRRAVTLLDAKFSPARAANLTLALAWWIAGHSEAQVVRRDIRKKTAVNNDRRTLRQLGLEPGRERVARAETKRVLKRACARFLTRADCKSAVELRETAPSPYARVVDDPSWS